MLTRDELLSAFTRAIIACDPARLVRAHLLRDPIPSPMIGVAIGKCALAMARGAGEVAAGIAVAPHDDDRGLPPGWTLMIGAHPSPDERSVAAGRAVRALVAGASPAGHVLALISGGASALAEDPRVPLAEFRARVAAAMAAGAPIAQLNALRTQLSHLKGGQLAARSRAPVTTLAISDVENDDLATIGSGPTIPCARAVLLAPQAAFAHALARELPGARLVDPVFDDVDAAAARLAATPPLAVTYGEPTLDLGPAPGEGGRAQHLALLLARAFAGTPRRALVLGTDGTDGPPPASRPHPAGAIVDGTTWRPAFAAALARRAAGEALATGDALVITGPTGINHSDVIVLA